MRMFACVVAVSVVGAVWAAEDAGYLIRLRSGGKPAFMRFVEADGKKIAAPLRPEEESVGQFGLPEARIGFWHRMGKFADGRLPCLYVRPSLNLNKAVEIARRVRVGQIQLPYVWAAA